MKYSYTLSFYINAGRYRSFFPRAYAYNQLFMHRFNYHIATSCIIKRENERDETRDLYHARSFCMTKFTQKISDILNACVTAMCEY